MKLDLLTAISPIDGRYRGRTEDLAAFFSEFALIKYRVQVEVEYFIALCELPLPQLKGVEKNVFEALRNIYRNFSETDAERIKGIERVTNHDVKAVEYFLKEEFDKLGGLNQYKEFIHFGLTSQDINNTSVPLSIKEALEQVYYPLIEELIAQLRTYACQNTRTTGFAYALRQRGVGVCVSLRGSVGYVKGLYGNGKVWRCYGQLQCTPCGLSAV